MIWATRFQRIACLCYDLRFSVVRFDHDSVIYIYNSLPKTSLTLCRLPPSASPICFRILGAHTHEFRIASIPDVRTPAFGSSGFQTSGIRILGFPDARVADCRDTPNTYSEESVSFPPNATGCAISFLPNNFSDSTLFSPRTPAAGEAAAS